MKLPPLEKLKKPALFDEEMKTLRPFAKRPAPAEGWIKKLRGVMDMTAAQLGKRLGVSQPRITQLERMERNGRTTLRTMNDVAEAMECQFVYAFVPKKSMAVMMESRAKELGERLFYNELVEMTFKGDSSVASYKRNKQMHIYARQLMFLRWPTYLWSDEIMKVDVGDFTIPPDDKEESIADDFLEEDFIDEEDEDYNI
ncbi:MAG TPA: hypothetical protein DCY07_01290 [Rhodospirillaceae bacterium]|nr:hypothetical protein [Rhodospirillaceae bacterium]